MSVALGGVPCRPRQRLLLAVSPPLSFKHGRLKWPRATFGGTVCRRREAHGQLLRLLFQVVAQRGSEQAAQEMLRHYCGGQEQQQQQQPRHGASRQQHAPGGWAPGLPDFVGAVQGLGYVSSGSLQGGPGGGARRQQGKAGGSAAGAAAARPSTPFAAAAAAAEGEEGQPVDGGGAAGAPAGARRQALERAARRCEAGARLQALARLLAGLCGAPACPLEFGRHTKVLARPPRSSSPMRCALPLPAPSGSCLLGHALCCSPARATLLSMNGCVRVRVRSQASGVALLQALLDVLLVPWARRLALCELTTAVQALAEAWHAADPATWEHAVTEVHMARGDEGARSSALGGSTRQPSHLGFSPSPGFVPGGRKSAGVVTRARLRLCGRAPRRWLRACRPWA